MNTQELLANLKIDLGIVTTAYDQRLTALLDVAVKELEREGVTLSLSDGAYSDISDANLVIEYASYLWRKRDSGEGMPRMLRWQINNRLFDMGSDSE